MGKMMSNSFEEEFFEESSFVQNDFKWKEYALCKGMKTQDFFPEKINKHNASKVRTIIQMCLECSVRTECLYEACTNEHDGIWAGCTFKERVNWAKSLGYKNVSLVSYSDCEDFFPVETNLHETD